MTKSLKFLEKTIVTPVQIVVVVVVFYVFAFFFTGFFFRKVSKMRFWSGKRSKSIMPEILATDL